MAARGPTSRLSSNAPYVPLLVLIEAAKSGNEKEVKEYAQVFREHANKLVEVSLARPISPLPSLPISLLFFSL